MAASPDRLSAAEEAPVPRRTDTEIPDELRVIEQELLEKYAPELARGEVTPELVLEEVDRIAEHLTAPIEAATPAEEIRMAIRRGFERTALERRLERLQDRMQVIGLRRLPSGLTVIGDPERPEDLGAAKPISGELAHAFVTAHEAGSARDWSTDEQQAFYHDVYRYLGREAEAAIPVVDADILDAAADIVRPIPPPLPPSDRERVADALAEWGQRESGIAEGIADAAEIDHMVGRAAREEATADVDRAIAAGTADFARERVVANAAAAVARWQEHLAEFRGERQAACAAVEHHRVAAPEITIEPEVVEEAREAYAEVAATERQGSRFGWVKERAKGILTAGITEFRHFFSYGRAARKEASAIQTDIDRMIGDATGATPDQIAGRVDALVDQAEERLMARLIDYRNQYGEWVLEPQRLDAFRDKLRTDLEAQLLGARDGAQERVRATIAEHFDPSWWRRGVYGVAELALAAGGVKLLINKFVMGNPSLPVSEFVPRPRGEVTVGSPEIIWQTPTPPDMSPMSKSIWHTLEQAYPGATDTQLIDASKAVLQQNGMYDSSSRWVDIVRNLEAAGNPGVDAAALPEGYPIKGILSPAVKAIMGIIGSVGV